LTNKAMGMANKSLGLKSKHTTPETENLPKLTIVFTFISRYFILTEYQQK